METSGTASQKGTNGRKKRDSIPLHQFVPLECMDNQPFYIGPLTPNPPADQSNFPHRHTFYEILFIRSGEGHHIVDFTTFDLTANTVYFISPGQIHWWEDTCKVEGVMIYFTEDFLIAGENILEGIKELDRMRNSELSPRILLNETDTRTLNQLIAIMVQEYDEKKYGYVLALREFVRILLIYMYRYNEDALVNPGQRAAESLVAQFYKLVFAHFTKEKHLKFYADTLGLSTGYLSDLIKEQTGFAPGDIIRRTIVMEAKRMMTGTELTVSQISGMLNFEDAAYFSRFFKRETGKTPSEYKAALKVPPGEGKNSLAP